MSHQEAVNVLQTAPTNVTLVMSWGTAPSHLSSKGGEMTAFGGILLDSNSHLIIIHISF